MTAEKAIILLLLPVLWAGSDAFPSNSSMNFGIQSHSLKIQIEPHNHLLQAEDEIEILLHQDRTESISLLLYSKLIIKSIVNSKTGERLRWHEVPYSDRLKQLNISLKKMGKGPASLSISYEGPIYDPVMKEKALQFVKGDETSGLIGAEGIYLFSSSYWYPDKLGSAAIFSLEVSIPEPFRVVTQGELLSEELKDGFWRSKWRSERPTEGLALVAGNYTVRSRKVNGVKISTYFFPEDDRFSKVFLDGAEEYLKIYPELLGPFPYRKFDIVQNFFSSGYSFPTFTLLAPEAIRQGKEFLRPGALDHEIVHSWWGHHVRAMPGTGNWSEALTTYCTNYFYKEWKMGQETASKHRQDVMQKYAIRVPSAKDYSLRQFKGKEGEIDGLIGYEKGSMVFHMLRQRLGKDLFFDTLKNFSRKYGGKYANWDDFKKAFKRAGGKKLDQFFSQWLDRPGGPRLKLEKVGYQVTPKGYLISGEVVQEGEIYELEVKVRIVTGGREKDLILDVSKRKNSFSIEAPEIPISLILDPDHHIFRRLYPEEVIPCLNAFLEGVEISSPPPSPSPVKGEGSEGRRIYEKIFVVPDEGKGDVEARKIYVELARMAKERKGGQILYEREVTEEMILRSSLLLLGESWKHPLFSKLLSTLPSPAILKDGIFILDGDKVDEKEESLLLTYPHPEASGKWITVYFGLSAEGLSRARYLFFYGWDSYVLFRKGRPERRGSFSPLRSFISYNFMKADHLNKMHPLESIDETGR